MWWAQVKRLLGQTLRLWSCLLANEVSVTFRQVNYTCDSNSQLLCVCVCVSGVYFAPSFLPLAKNSTTARRTRRDSLVEFFLLSLSLSLSLSLESLGECFSSAICFVTWGYKWFQVCLSGCLVLLECDRTPNCISTAMLLSLSLSLSLHLHSLLLHIHSHSHPHEQEGIERQLTNILCGQVTNGFFHRPNSLGCFSWCFLSPCSWVTIASSLFFFFIRESQECVGHATCPRWFLQPTRPSHMGHVSTLKGKYFVKCTFRQVKWRGGDRSYFLPLPWVGQLSLHLDYLGQRSWVLLFKHRLAKLM